MLDPGSTQSSKSALRIEYPCVRGVLLDAWRAARSSHADTAEARTEIMDKSGARRRYQKPEAGRSPENKFGMRRWRSSHRAAKYCEEIRTGPGGWFLRGSRHVDAQLHGRLPLRSIVWSSCVELLRFLCRLSSGIVGDLGRKGRCRRLAQQQIHRCHRQQSAGLPSLTTRRATAQAARTPGAGPARGGKWSLITPEFEEDRL